MDEKQIKELLEQVKASVGESQALMDLKSDLDNFKNDAMTPEQFTEKMDKFAEENDIAGISKSVEDLAIEVKKMRDNGPKKEVTLRDRLVEKRDVLKELANGSKSVRLDLDGVKTNVTRSSVTSHTLAYRLPDVGQEAYRATVLASQFRQANIGPDNNGTIRYVDQSTVTRNAATRAEAAQYPESAIAWTEYSLPVEKMADSIPVTHEALNDVDFVESEIRRLLEVNMRILEDTQVYSGDGVTPNLKGVYTSATAFTDTTPKIQDASIYDVLNVVKTKIYNGKRSKYAPNVVLMNPADVLEMHSKKDGNNNYVIPPFVSADGMMVAGMQIVESATVTANTIVVGDFNYGTYYTSEGFEIEIGWVNDQFIKDLMTIKARKRAALLIRTIDADAFYKVTDLDAIKSGITA